MRPAGGVAARVMAAWLTATLFGLDDPDLGWTDSADGTIQRVAR